MGANPPCLRIFSNSERLSLQELYHAILFREQENYRHPPPPIASPPKLSSFKFSRQSCDRYPSLSLLNPFSFLCVILRFKFGVSFWDLNLDQGRFMSSVTWRCVIGSPSSSGLSNPSNSGLLALISREDLNTRNLLQTLQLFTVWNSSHITENLRFKL